MIRRAHRACVLAVVLVGCSSAPPTRTASAQPEPPAAAPPSATEPDAPTEPEPIPDTLLEPLPSMLAGDSAAWDAYVAALPADGGAPPEVIARIHALEPNLSKWRTGTLTESDWDASDARWDPFIAWMDRGLFRAAPTGAGVLAGRLFILRHERIDLEATLHLVEEARTHAPSTADLAGALMLACGRLHHAHRFAEVLPLAEEAVEVAEAVGDAELSREAKIWNAAGLVHREDFEAGFDILEAQLPAPTRGLRPPLAHLAGSTATISFPDDPRDEARFELVEIVGFSLFRFRGGAYTRALGCIAETYSDSRHGKALWSRYERALALLHRSHDAGTELDTVVLQTKQRGCNKASAAARR